MPTTSSTSGKPRTITIRRRRSRRSKPRCSLINAADDERNPPETGVTDAALKRVKNGRLFLIPASSETRGHLTTGNAKFYKKQLRGIAADRAAAGDVEPAEASARCRPAVFAGQRSLSPARSKARISGTADFRVGKRIFATLGYPDEDWGMVKLTPEQQSMLVEAEPDIFRPVPGGWGKQGYTNVRLAKADATTLKSALTMAWQNVAPKSQAKARGKPTVRDGRPDFAPHRFASSISRHYWSVHAPPR